MKIQDIKKMLDATLLSTADHLGEEVSNYYPAFNISDILTFVQIPVLIITEITDFQIIHLAVVSGAQGIVFVNNKKPKKNVLEMAYNTGIPMLSTTETMGDVNTKLHENGLGIKEERTNDVYL